MTKRYRDWGDSERAESRGTGMADDAAIARMQARLEASLGAEFDKEVERPSAARSTTQLRRLGWLGAGAMVAVSVMWGSRPAARESPPPAAALAAAEPQHTSASSLQPDEPPAPAPAEALQPDEPPAPPPAEALQPDETPAPVSRRGARAKRPANSVRAAELSTVGKPKPAADGGMPSASATSPAVELGLTEELIGLDRIRSLVIKSPERALAVAEQQAHQFPSGALGPERALLQLGALMRLGRTAEAQQLASQLLAEPAKQPYRTRINEILATAR